MSRKREAQASKVHLSRALLPWLVGLWGPFHLMEASPQNRGWGGGFGLNVCLSQSLESLQFLGALSSRGGLAGFQFHPHNHPLFFVGGCSRLLKKLTSPLGESKRFVLLGGFDSAQSPLKFLLPINLDRKIFFPGFSADYRWLSHEVQVAFNRELSVQSLLQGLRFQYSLHLLNHFWGSFAKRNFENLTSNWSFHLHWRHKGRVNAAVDWLELNLEVLEAQSRLPSDERGLSLTSSGTLPSPLLSNSIEPTQVKLPASSQNASYQPQLASAEPEGQNSSPNSEISKYVVKNSPPKKQLDHERPGTSSTSFPPPYDTQSVCSSACAIASSHSGGPLNLIRKNDDPFNPSEDPIKDDLKRSQENCELQNLRKVLDELRWVLKDSPQRAEKLREFSEAYYQISKIHKELQDSDWKKEDRDNKICNLKQLSSDCDIFNTFKEAKFDLLNKEECRGERLSLSFADLKFFVVKFDLKLSYIEASSAGDIGNIHHNSDYNAQGRLVLRNENASNTEDVTLGAEDSSCFDHEDIEASKSIAWGEVDPLEKDSTGTALRFCIPKGYKKAAKTRGKSSLFSGILQTKKPECAVYQEKALKAALELWPDLENDFVNKFFVNKKIRWDSKTTQKSLMTVLLMPLAYVTAEAIKALEEEESFQTITEKESKLGGFEQEQRLAFMPSYNVKSFMETKPLNSNQSILLLKAIQSKELVQEAQGFLEDQVLRKVNFSTKEEA